jgi:hypothetical protein
MTSASILAVTTLRSSLSIYVFFVYSKISFPNACFLTSSLEFTFRIALIDFSQLINFKSCLGSNGALL